MTRREWLYGCVGSFGAGATAAIASPRDISLVSGLVTASEHEVVEGYFGVAQKTMLMVTPDSPACLHLRELRGHTIELIARVL